MADFTGFTPDYQDYVDFYNKQNTYVADDSGTNTSVYGTPITADAYAALSDADKWKLLNNQFMLGQSDPRYAQYSPFFSSAATPDNNPVIYFNYGGTPSSYGRDITAQDLIDPSLMRSAGGVTGYSTANLSPDFKTWESGQSGHLSPGEMALIFGPILGAAAYAGASALGVGADTAASSAPIDVSTSDLGALAPSGMDAASTAPIDVSTSDLGALAPSGMDATSSVPADVSTSDLGGLAPSGLDSSATVPADTTSFSPPADVAPTPDVTTSAPDFTPPADFSLPGDSTSLTPDLANSIPTDVQLAPPPDVSPALPDIQTSGFDLSSLGGDALNYVEQHPFKTAAGAFSVANILAQYRRGGSIPGQLRDVAAPLSGEAQKLLDQYGRGELNPGDEWAINKWEMDNIARVKNYYASAGQGDSTASLNAQAQVEAQAQAMRDKSLQGLLMAGINASGMAIGPLTAAIEAEAKNDAALGSAQANALRALMQLFAGSGTSPTATATGG